MSDEPEFYCPKSDRCENDYVDNCVHSHPHPRNEGCRHANASGCPSCVELNLVIVIHETCACRGRRHEPDCSLKQENSPCSD